MSSEEHDYNAKIQALKSMFGDLVTTEVIIDVMESCSGDPDSAAVMLMSITNESPLSEEVEENATGGGYPSITYNDPQKFSPESPDGETEQNLVPFRSSREIHSEEFYSECAMQHLLTSKEEDITTSRPVSYAEAFRNTGAVPKLKDSTDVVKSSPNVPNTFRPTFWTNQLKDILMNYSKGYRVMIILRGVPGSGKTFLARQIIEMTVGGGSVENLSNHIFSADDFFMIRGRYVYNKNLISEAHMNNQKRVNIATQQGVSPVIIDNTNVKIWEMEPYIRDGVRNGYYIEIVEPNTEWVTDANMLSRLNVHKVPKDKIRQMLDNFDRNITSDFLMKYFNVKYPKNKTPPVMRSIPPPPEQNIPITVYEKVKSPEDNLLKKENKVKTSSPSDNMTSVHSLYSPICEDDANKSSVPQDYKEGSQTTNKVEEKISCIEEKISCIEDEVIETAEKFRYANLDEAEKRLKEFQKIDIEWDNSENWDDGSDNVETKVTVTNELITLNPPKPPRNADNLIDSSYFAEDWTKISMFMPPWQDNATAISNVSPIDTVKTTTSSTCFEIGDTEIAANHYKILSGTPRDINENFKPDTKKEKIPHQRMLDKSTSTHEAVLKETIRCKNEEQHFIAFRRMFKNVPRATLREIFNKCLGDVNWAVNIVLDSVGGLQCDSLKSEDISDTEDEVVEECECLAAYNIIPESTTETFTSTLLNTNRPDSKPETPVIQKKIKRERKISDSSLQIKRQIESNVVITSHHYSPHVLSLKRAREEFNNPLCNTEAHRDSNNIEDTTEVVTENVLSENNTIKSLVPYEDDSENEAVASTSSHMPIFGYYVNSYLEDNAGASMDKIADGLDSVDLVSAENETVSANLGMEFINQLDELFGRKGMIYPENIKPVVSIPMSLLKEINALWAESIAFQMDESSIQTEEMIKEDKEFARQLALKEQNMSKENKEPDVPDFKEIMDMDLALSIYEREVAEWRNAEPQDMAARMTRDKLYNLFPDVDKNLLSELLMAHDNNFYSTVESLLASTGQTHVLTVPNGIKKFVMEKEMEKKEKILAEERLALSRNEWPFIANPNFVVTMDTVNGYRQEAECFLASRSANVSKIHYYMSRNMLSAAMFYTDIARYDRRRYEQANSMAVASLIQYHANNNPGSGVIDLHYLRVAEAKEALDLYIDSMIQKLRESTPTNRVGRVSAYIITGRGLHSQGTARLKPAVVKRMEERGIPCTERNPGLLIIKLKNHNKLTHELVTEAI